MNFSKNSRQVILDMKIARIIKAYCERYDTELADATDAYYNSVTSEMIEEGIADLHCRSDLYLADELHAEIEKRNKKNKNLN